MGEAVELIDQLVNLFICGGNLAVEDGLVVRGIGGGEFVVEIEHGGDKLDHVVVLGLVLGIVEVHGGKTACPRLRRLRLFPVPDCSRIVPNTYLPDFLRLSSLHNIWQFAAFVLPPSCQGLT